nr:MAG TPA: hypothetical protein [Bacteriophage sp.]
MVSQLGMQTENIITTALSRFPLLVLSVFPLVRQADRGVLTFQVVLRLGMLFHLMKVLEELEGK